MLVFLGGVLITFIILFLLMTFMIYMPLTSFIYETQKREAASGHTDIIRSEYPQLWELIKNFMLGVFLLSAMLYFSTKGNPTGLTYNVVRGTWVKGISVVTVTTCVMLISVVFAAQMLIDVVLGRLTGYLSPKGKTICRLIDSGTAYIGAVITIVYTLSMLGVNTATLIGGVGAAALVFTLGANSLIADVLAGLFIIFEGDFTVGDVVTIDDFRGIVIDISMRTTKLMDDNTRDIRIINNSEIKEPINQSRENSVVIVDFGINSGADLDVVEKVVEEEIARLPELFPKIIGTPQYWGVSQLPKKNDFTGKLGGSTLRIAFNCKEEDREMLTYQVYEELVGTVKRVNEEPEKKDGV